MTKADFRSLWRIQASGAACAVNLASFLKAKAPKRRPISLRKVQKKQERLVKRAVRADVRAACVARAGIWCENPGCSWPSMRLEMDHFYGRAFSESVETCWMLCRWCHETKTRNDPTREMWDAAFRLHGLKNGYPLPRKRLTKNLARSSLERSDSTDMGSVGLVTGGLPLSTESK